MNEFELIRQFFVEPTTDASVQLGIGDDCAILAPSPQQEWVITTDTSVAGRHFPLDTDAYSVGWKTLAVNLSDVAAMGACPRVVLLALSLPEVNPVWLAQFRQGFFDLAKQHAVQLIGGDTTKSSVLSITITAMGTVTTGQAIRRSGAQVGDWVVVTGSIGDAAYALRYPHSELQHRLDRPIPRVNFAQGLAGYVHAMLDISDGLAQDLGHILVQSGVGAVLDWTAIPKHPMLNTLTRSEQQQLVLSGGDDYELCLTIAPKAWPVLQQWAIQTHTPIHVIGQITATQGLVLSCDGQQQPWTQTGFMHFDSTTTST
jgi:thiamine-monophosphate kinase